MGFYSKAQKYDTSRNPPAPVKGAVLDHFWSVIKPFGQKFPPDELKQLISGDDLRDEH